MILSPATGLATMLEDRALCVVRAPAIPDAGGLVDALAAGGIRTVELTFTTPDLLAHLAVAVRAADDAPPGTTVGVGTVRTAEQARAAVDTGAAFLVTPGLRPEVAAVAAAAGVPVVMGALTPSEVLEAHELGAAAVKVFPASAFGPRYLRDLSGPYPDVPLVPSGGVTAANAHEFLAAGAVAVTAGTGVVPPEAVAAGDWADITSRASEFTGGL